jgi:hypothetical protein
MPNDNSEALNAEVNKQAEAMGLTPEDIDGGLDLTEIKAGEELNPGFNTDAPQGEEKPEDPTPEEKPEEGKMEDDSKIETDDKSSDPKVKAREEFKKRETKQMFDDFKSEIFAGIEEKFKGFQTATPTEKKEIKAEVSEDIKQFASKYKDADGNPLNAEFLEDFAAAIVAKTTKSLPVDLQKLSELTAKDKAQEENNQFNNEWDKVLSKIKGQFPNASDEQLSKAKTEMKETLSKSDVKDMEYLYLHKAADKFKTILFSPKRKTAESGHVGEADMPDEGDTPFNYETLTPERASKVQSEIDEFYSKKKK